MEKESSKGMKQASVLWGCDSAGCNLAVQGSGRMAILCPIGMAAELLQNALLVLQFRPWNALGW